MTYKLTLFDTIIKDGITAIPADPANADYQEYLAWVAAGNTPQPADLPTEEQLAREAEIQQAPLTARQWFTSRPAAVAFIRLTPAEQEAWIEAATLAQLKTLLAYLTVAVAAAIKREFL